MYTYIAIFVLATALVVFACGDGRRIDTFSGRPRAGIFYDATGRRGTAVAAAFGEKVVLYDQRFRIWSCETEPDVALRVTSGSQYELHVRSNGRIDNLPAVLGGLPAHENYTGLFNSGGPVTVEFVPLADAERAVEASLTQCITNLQFDEGVCREEYSRL